MEGGECAAPMAHILPVLQPPRVMAGGEGIGPPGSELVVSRCDRRQAADEGLSVILAPFLITFFVFFFFIFFFFFFFFFFF